ncbi:Adhesion G protein-coupled receptor A3 [Oryzias melastigma]|uniref:Adhesion G protein-coupled receptor A1 n=2 Tax=Oryzias melastigma TaxID=30732 RepID=A0A3B3B6S0_ORYME|nr:adhesion G protein-coupled receptor A3 [Oryzias melastigma]KAF6737411.1 Adhesion G protein-coupled receptor A3 [Oryzias melastigma]
MRALSVFSLTVLLWPWSQSSRTCPDLIADSCHCSAHRSKDPSRQRVRVRVLCDDVDLMDTLPVSALPNTTGSLNLSNNKISLLRNGSFFGLAALEKLDLKNNLISIMEPGAFRGLLALRILDLSNNRIGCLSPEMFIDLRSLLKLNLSGNIFSTLTAGLFTSLVSLKVLHFSTETLFCDCHMKWLLIWAQSNSVRIGNDTVCVFPTHLHGLVFHILQGQQLTCDSPLELPLFQLIPSQKQLVFRGDRLPLQCTASYLDPSVELQWRHNGHTVTTQENWGVYVEETLLHDCCLVTSEVILSNIDVNAAGSWECVVTSSRGNASKHLEIVVVETSALYCPSDRANNNKGDYSWPKTLAGSLAFQPCALPTSGSSTQKEKKAWRRCDRAGRWAEEDYTQCPYTSEVTRGLHALAQIPINGTNVQPLGQQLVAFTSRAAHFTDVMDVIFVTHLVERLTRLMQKHKKLGDYVSDIASNMMLVEEHLLWMAQNEARACTRIVKCVERIADLALTGDSQVISKVSANIALEAFVIRPSNFQGLSCTALQWAPSSGASSHTASLAPSEKDRSPEQDVMEESLLNLKCQTVNSSASPASQLSKNSVAVASIHFPLAGAPVSSSALQSVDNSTCRLQFIVFRNGKLFPCTGNSSNLADDGKRRSVSTPVAFTKLDGCSRGSGVHSVTIALRHFALGVDPTAAYWDFDLLDGHGGWRAEGCHITGSGGSTTTIHCSHQSNFAVLMDLKKVLSFPPYPGEFLHPVVYACTAVMLLCLFASIITYIVHHSAIRISRKGWHTLLNFCFHTALTFAVFASGINRIKYPIICQAVGFVLHYSSLSTMLWLGVMARNIYKQVTKKPPQNQVNAPPPSSKQTLLRFYLVSGGVPLLICGVTAAVNIDNYGSGEQAPYCWMAWEPSLGAFFGPVAFIVLVTCIYFLCAFIQLRRHPEKKYELKRLTEEQQRLAGIDIPTHCHQGAEPGALTAHPSGSSCPAGCPGVPINPALLANEHSFRAQLRTAAFTLFLFLVTWTFGALAVSQGHFLDMIFSCLYGAFSVTLGLFILIHHCAKRDDVWHCWCSCCPGRRPDAGSGAQGSAAARPKVNINGDTPGHGHSHNHCHHDSQCQGKTVISCSHGSLGHCKHAALPSSQNHLTCLTPVTPCCATLRSQQLMEEEPAATHVLLHSDAEGCRPGVQLHPCLKSSTRTKSRQFGRRAGAAACGVASEREYAYHISSSADGGSMHSSHTDSPHSTHEPHTHICPHLAHEGHHACHAAAAETLACHNPCHRHICCAKADLFPSLCQAEAGDTGVFLCGCGKVAEEEPTHHHLEMHAPRRQSYPQTPPNQNGILKGGLHEGLLYTSDSTGNIRTGPWKNETTV